MRRILETCVEMDQLACDAYRLMSDAVDDMALAMSFKLMAEDEAEHVAWWKELVEAWDSGLLPDIATEPERLSLKLQTILQDMQSAVPSPGTALSTEDAHTIATKLEFMMLDPCFGELLDLMEPALASRRHAEYAQHLERLIGAILDHHPKGSLTSFLATVLRRAWRDNRLLSSYAMRDPLTGLLNRRAFHAQLRQWTAWAARYGRPLAVLLVDVDRFKLVNDTRGHAVGDAALVAIADALVHSVRTADLVGRYGGDEFVILAPETDQDLLWQLGDRILETVRMTAPAEDLHVTVSVGGVVASDRPGAEPRTTEELMSAADQALYSAKEMGRDRAAPPVVLSRV
jgi:diguanylate cyclase (GGDEF)-like protein